MGEFDGLLDKYRVNSHVWKEYMEAQARQIIQEKSKENMLKYRKSYVITNRDGETDKEITFFGKRGFDRG